MRKNDNKPVTAAAFGAAVLVGFLMTIFCMAASALAVLFGGLSADYIPLWADICLALGCFSAALLAAKRTPSWQPLWGLGAGTLLFVCLVILTLAWFGQGVYFPRLLANAALSVAFAAVGGALGTRRPKRRKHRKNF